MPAKIISLSGRKGSGKTTICDVCTDYGYTLINFSDGLKMLVCELFLIPIELLNRNKEKLIKLEIVENHVNILHKTLNINKNIIRNSLPSHFNSIRHALQFIGTNLIRAHNPNWHVENLKKNIEPDKKYCIGDCRFKNELNTVKKLGGEYWFIIRPSNMEISNHPSEIDLLWTDFGDNIIVNNNSQEYLESDWKHYMKTDKKPIPIYSRSPYTDPRAFLEVNELTVYVATLFLSCIHVVSSKSTLQIRSGDRNLVFLFQKCIKHFGQIGIHKNGYYLETNNPFIMENIKLWQCQNKDDIPIPIQGKPKMIDLWKKGLKDQNKLFRDKNIY